jgi:hypothetical protein
MRMFQFLFRITFYATLLGLGALAGFVYGRSDLSDSIALNSVANVCGIADTSLGSYLPQQNVDNAVRNMADLFKLSDEERSRLAVKAERVGKSTPCLDALAQLEPRSIRSAPPKS